MSRGRMVLWKCADCPKTKLVLASVAKATKRCRKCHMNSESFRRFNSIIKPGGKS